MKRCFMALALGLGFFFLASQPAAADSAAALPLVWLDAGHGGQDPGAQAGSFKESAFTLDLAKRVSARLKSHGLRCDLSRDTDKSLSVTARVLDANTSGASVAVSLHVNFSFSKASRGVRVFVPAAGGRALSVADPKGGSPLVLLRWDQASSLSVERSQRLGSALASRLEQGQSSRRGVQALPLAIFHGMIPPVAEVECGFASNPDDLKTLQDDKETDNLADRIAQGILSYLGL